MHFTSSLGCPKILGLTHPSDGLAMVAWAGHYEAGVMDAFAEEARGRILEFSQQNLVRPAGFLCDTSKAAVRSQHLHLPHLQVAPAISPLLDGHKGSTEVARLCYLHL